MSIERSMWPESSTSGAPAHSRLLGLRQLPLIRTVVMGRPLRKNQMGPCDGFCTPSYFPHPGLGFARWLLKNRKTGGSVGNPEKDPPLFVGSGTGGPMTMGFGGGAVGSIESIGTGSSGLVIDWP